MKTKYRIRSFPEGEPALEPPDGALPQGPLKALYMQLLGQERAAEALAGYDLAEVGRWTRAEVVERVRVPDILADSLVAAVELGRRVAIAEKRRESIHGAAQIAARLVPVLAGRKQEVFIALALDAKNRVTHEFRIAEGTLTSCPVRPCEAFRPLVRVGASGTIFVHNHPSGDPAPSEEDVRLTTLLAFSGETLGIRVLDHVVLGHLAHYSFSESGLLQRGRRS